LYFVGRSLEGAALLVEPGRSVLFAPKPDPEEELWSGAMPSLAELAEGCGVEVRPIDELEAPPEDDYGFPRKTQKVRRSRATCWDATSSRPVGPSSTKPTRGSPTH
jgi:hypothetical protein